MSDHVNQIKLQLMNNERGEGSIFGRPSLGVEQAAEQILRANRFWALNESGPTHITYSFMTKDNFPGYHGQMSDFFEFSENQKAHARLALETWSDVANIQFDEVVNTPAQVMLGNVSGGLADGGVTILYTSSHPSHESHLSKAHIWINPTGHEPALGNYDHEILVHETGHALGLEHPGEYNSDDDSHEGGYDAMAPYVEDTRMYSVMSYWSEFETNGDFKGTSGSGPMMDDIYAVQNIYGINPTAFAGDTTYGFNSNTERPQYTATSPNDKLVFCVWDSGGNDTFDFSGYSNDQVINIQQGSFSSVGGLSRNVSIAVGTNIENIKGGSGNDILIGNDDHNTIMGNGGNNIIYGAGGADTLWGGPGNNVFVYLNVTDSTPEAADCIVDFDSGSDRIDISAIYPTFVMPLVIRNDEDSGTAQLSAKTNTGHDFMLNLVGHVDPAQDIIFS